MINGYARKKTTGITTISFYSSSKRTPNWKLLQLAKLLLGLLLLNISKRTEVLGTGIRNETFVFLCWLINNSNKKGPGRFVQPVLGMGTPTAGGKWALQNFLSLSVTEPQNCRICWAGKHPGGSLSPTPSLVQDHLQETHHVSKNIVQTFLELCQAYWCDHFPGETVPVFHTMTDS